MWTDDYWDGDGMYGVMPKCPFCNKEDYCPIYNTLLSLNDELNRIDKPVRNDSCLEILSVTSI